MYNSIRKTVSFYYGADPCAFGVLTLNAFAESGIEARLGDSEVDDAVRYIQLGRIPKAKKDEMLARREAEDQAAKEHEMEKHLAERRPDATDFADFLHRERCGTTKLISV